MLRRLLALGLDAATGVGILIILTGGFRIRRHPNLPNLDMMQYGVWFLPLAVCLVAGLRPRGSRALGAVDRFGAFFDALPAPRQTAWTALAIGLCTAAHALVVYLRYYAFQSSMDLAIYANACRGALYSTMKGDVWLFADHFEPVLILFTPLCRVFSPAITLLTVQTLGWGIGAFGCFVLARHMGYRPVLTLLISLLYLGFSGHATLAYYDFHLLSLTLALLPWLWWSIVAERNGWLVALALLYLGLKESVALSLVGLGAFLALGRSGSPQQRRLGVAFILLGVACFALIMKVMYPAFRGGAGTMYFAKYYGHLGNDLSEFLRTLVTRPVYFAASLLRPGKLGYVFMLLAPVLLFPIVRPRYLLPVLPAILVNILSNDENLHGRRYHYEAEIYPALFAMAVIVFATSRWRALWLAVVLTLFTGASPLGLARWSVPTPVHRQLRAQLERYVPHDRAIAAPQRIAAHLTDREKLYMFDYWQMEEDWRRAEIVVIGYHGEWVGWYTWNALQSEKLPRMLPELRQIFEAPEDPRFKIYEVVQLAPSR